MSDKLVVDQLQKYSMNLHLIGCLSLSTNILSLAWKRSIFPSEGSYQGNSKKSIAIKIVTQLALTAEDETALKD